jgi:hypothetical protein
MFFNKVLLVVSGIILISHPLSAQKTPSEKVKERIEEAFDEKLRRKSISFEPEEKVLAKSTTGDQRITPTNAYEESESTIAINPLDSNKVVVSFMETANNVINNVIYYSDDAGDTWTKSDLNSKDQAALDFPGFNYDTGCDATLAWDKNGRVYVSWITMVSNPILDSAYICVYWAYSDNNGQDWILAPGNDRFIAKANCNGSYGYDDNGDGFCDRQWLAVDNSNGPYQGRVYCSFVRFGTVDQFSGIRYKPVGSNTFSQTVPVYVGFTQFNNVEVDTAGVLHIVFAELDANVVLHASSTDGGQTFSPLHQVGSYLPTTFQGGFLHDRENVACNLVSDGKGYLHAVWTDKSIITSHYARSQNGGQTWTAIDISTIISPLNSSMSTIAANGDNVAISFSGFNNSDTVDYYCLTSTDNGFTFNSPQLLSTDPTNFTSQLGVFFGDYNRSVSSPGCVYSIWCDGRNSLGPKAYFARKGYDTVSTVEVTMINSPVQLKSLYPNPAKDRTSLNFSSSVSQEIDIVLYDLTGKKLLERKAKVENGNSTIVFALPQLSSGIYSISGLSANGLLFTRKIQIQ